MPLPLLPLLPPAPLLFPLPVGPPLHPLEGPDEETNLITQWALLKTATGLQQIWIEHPSCGGVGAGGVGAGGKIGTSTIPEAPPL